MRFPNGAHKINTVITQVKSAVLPLRRGVFPDQEQETVTMVAGERLPSPHSPSSNSNTKAAGPLSLAMPIEERPRRATPPRRTSTTPRPPGMTNSPSTPRRTPPRRATWPRRTTSPRKTASLRANSQTWATTRSPTEAAPRRSRPASATPQTMLKARTRGCARNVGIARP